MVGVLKRDTRPPDQTRALATCLSLEYDHPIATSEFPKVESALGERPANITTGRTRASRLQEEVTRRQSRLERRIPVHEHAPDCVLDNVSQRPIIHRLLQRPR